VDYLDAVKVLRDISLFSQLDQSKLKLLAFASDYQTFEDGEILFLAGDPSDAVYLIDEGEAEAYVDVEGQDITVATLGKSDLIGEMGIFRNRSRSAAMRAKGQLKVIRIEGELFIQMVTENPEAALGVMRALSDKISKATESYEELKASIAK